MSFRRKALLTIGAIIVVLPVIFFALGGKLTLTPHYNDRDELTAIQDVAAMHANYNAGEFHKIYDSYSTVFKSRVDPATAISAMQDAYNTLGPFQAVIDCRINIVMAAQPQIRIVEQVKFANEVRTEMIVFLEEADEINLLNYSLAKGSAHLPDDIPTCPQSTALIRQLP